MKSREFPEGLGKVKKSENWNSGPLCKFRPVGINSNWWGEICNLHVHFKWAKKVPRGLRGTFLAGMLITWSWIDWGMQNHVPLPKRWMICRCRTADTSTSGGVFLNEDGRGKHKRWSICRWGQAQAVEHLWMVWGRDVKIWMPLMLQVFIDQSLCLVTTIY